VIKSNRHMRDRGTVQQHQKTTQKTKCGANFLTAWRLLWWRAKVISEQLVRAVNQMYLH
jgi:hypothetical protein